MNKKDIIRKLSSRKFWTALIAWLTSVCAAFGVADSAVTQVTVIVSGIGALCVYMLAEGMADNGGRIDDDE